MKPTAFIRRAATSDAHPVDMQRLTSDLDRMAEIVGDARRTLWLAIGGRRW